MSAQGIECCKIEDHLASLSKLARSFRSQMDHSPQIWRKESLSLLEPRKSSPEDQERIAFGGDDGISERLPASRFLGCSPSWTGNFWAAVKPSEGWYEAESVRVSLARCSFEPSTQTASKLTLPPNGIPESSASHRRDQGFEIVIWRSAV